MVQGQVQIAAAFMMYFIFGGAFPIGQLLAVELGRYEIWSHRRRLIIGSTLYLASFVPALAILLILEWDLRLLPWVLIGVLILAKVALNQLNTLMPDKFQPTEKELRERYGGIFKVDQAEINAILEDNFTKKLGFDRRTRPKPRIISFLRGEDLDDDEGLTEAIEEYMEKERRRKRGVGGG